MGGVAVYLRVSTEDQMERQTVENQRDFARGYAKLHRLGEPLEYADEGYSGTIPLEQRPAGQQLLQAAALGAIDTVYVYKLDRLGRSARVILNAKAELEARGARLVSMTEPFDTRDASGQFLLTVLSGVAALERDNIVERTQAGIRRSANLGRWVAGPAPYGYRLEQREQGNFLVVDEETPANSILSAAAVVRLLYQRVGAEGWSTTQARDEIRALHIPPRTEPGSRLNRMGAPVVSGWHANTIARLLNKPVYKGVQIFGRKSARGQIETACPALVTPELWGATREQMQRGFRESGLRPDAGYLLTGLLHCPECGKRMGGIVARNRYQTEYHYYRCIPTTIYPACPAGAVTMAEADRRAWREVERLLSDPGVVLRAAEERMRAAIPPAPDKRAAAEKALANCRLERERLVAAIRRGHIPDDLADRELAAIAQEEAQARLDLAALSPVVPTDWRQDAGVLIAATRETLAGGLGAETKRKILRVLCRRFVVRRGSEWQMEWSFLPQSVYNSG